MFENRLFGIYILLLLENSYKTELGSLTHSSINMLNSFSVYLLSLFICADAYFLKFLRSGERRFSPKSTIYRDDYIDYYWPENTAINLLDGNAKKFLSKPKICDEKPSKNVERGTGEKSMKPKRNTPKRSSNCRQVSRRTKSLLSRALHTRHDDTKYVVKSPLIPRRYSYSRYKKGSGMKRTKGKHRPKRRCHDNKKKHMRCVDVDYFNQAFEELKQLLLKISKKENKRERKSKDRRVFDETSDALLVEKDNTKEQRDVEVQPEVTEEKSKRQEQ